MLISICISAQDIAGSESALLNKILDGYDKRFPPPGKIPVIVDTNIFIRSFERVSTKDMEFTVQMLYQQRWNDSRLTFRNESGLDYITVREPYAIWNPDIYFTNSVASKTHNYYARIFPNGEVFLSEHKTVTFSCLMGLKYYPFDSQICPITIASCKSESMLSFRLTKKLLPLY